MHGGTRGRRPSQQSGRLMQSDSPPVIPRIGVGAVVFNGDAVLLVKRAQPPSENLWAIPGGRLEAGETLQHAAEREILEETGIVIQAGDPIYTFDVIERDAEGRLLFHYVIVDLEATYVSGTPRAGDDAHDARWVQSDQLHSLPVSDKTLHLLRELGFAQ